MTEKEVVIITGCSGRIGFKLAERLSQEYLIAGFDLILVGHLPQVEFIIVDMASDVSVKSGLDYVKKNYGKRIASVVHLAAYYSFSNQTSSNYETITVQGTRRLLEGLKEFDVEQFIFSSTMLVHAPCALGQTIDENWPVVAKWAYPESKVKAEEIIRDLHGTIPYVIARIAGVYDDHCHSIPLAHQMQRIYEKQLESHFFAGKLSHGASFMHLDDLVEALCLLVKKRSTLPKETVILLGEPETLSYGALQKEFGRGIWGKEWITISLPKPLAKIGAFIREHIPFLPKPFIKPWMIDLADDHYALNISYARKLLQWEPKHSLKATLPLMIQELKNDPRTWYDENQLK